MAVICQKCHRSVEPIKTVEISPKTKKKWLVHKCPHERCGFNIDLELYTARPATPADQGRYLWKNYGLW